MPDLDDAVKALIDLNWSEYESKTYAALVYLGNATASNISKKANVPSNRTYQILERLVNKGYAKRLSGKGEPARFIPENPDKLLDEMLDKFSKLIKTAKEKLNILREREKIVDIPISYTILGRQSLDKYVNEILDEAKVKVSIYVDTLIELEHSMIIDKLNNLKKNGIEVSILTSERGLNDIYEINTYKKLKDIEVLLSDYQIASILVIVDRKYCIFTSFAYDSRNKEHRNYFGMYLEDSKSSRMFQKMFDDAWNDGLLPPIISEEEKESEEEEEEDILL